MYILYFVVIVLVRLPIWNANDYHFSILFGQKKAGKIKNLLPTIIFHQQEWLNFHRIGKPQIYEN